MAELTKLKSAEVNRSGLQEERGALRPAGIIHSAQAELLQEFFDQPLQIVNVELRLALVAAPEERVALAGQGDGHMALFAALAIGLGEDAASLEQGGVVGLVADIVAERVEQPRQQAGAQHIHIRAQRVGQRD